MYNCPKCTSLHAIDYLGKYNFMLYTKTASRNYNTSYLPNIIVLVFGNETTVLYINPIGFQVFLRV